MDIVLTMDEFRGICKDMAELGAAEYIRQTKPGQDLISQREAFRLFGESRVRRWIKSGQGIYRERSGESERGKILYSKADLLSVDKTERMTTIRVKKTKN